LVQIKHVHLLISLLYANQMFHYRFRH